MCKDIEKMEWIADDRYIADRNGFNSHLSGDQYEKIYLILKRN